MTTQMKINSKLIIISKKDIVRVAWRGILGTSSIQIKVGDKIIGEVDTLDLKLPSSP